MARGPLGVTRAGKSPTPAMPGTLDYLLRSIRGGKKRVMALAPAAVNYEPRLVPIIEKWQQMSAWQRRTTTLDDLIAQADLSPGEFIAAVAWAAYETGSTLTPWLVMEWAPDVIKASAKRALNLRKGFPDRKLLLEYTFSEPWRQAGDVGSQVEAPQPGGRAPDLSFLSHPSSAPSSGASEP